MSSLSRVHKGNKMLWWNSLIHLGLLQFPFRSSFLLPPIWMLQRKITLIKTRSLWAQGSVALSPVQRTGPLTDSFVIASRSLSTTMLPGRSAFIPMDCFTTRTTRAPSTEHREEASTTAQPRCKQGRQQYSVSKKIRLLLKSLGRLLFTSSQICVLTVAEGVFGPVQLSPKVPQCEQDTVLDYRDLRS